jgi:hypothetical protein
MHRRSVAGLVLLAVASLVACGPQPERDGVPDAALQQDLDQARTRALELASSAQSYQPMRFVSAIEQAQPDNDVREPVDVVRPAVAESIHVTPPSVEAVALVEFEPEAPLETAAATVAVPRVPSVIPRDAPVPEQVAPDYGPRRPDRGPDLRTRIGVVIRGGAVGPDHCVPHRRPPSVIPNRIPP